MDSGEATRGSMMASRPNHPFDDVGPYLSLLLKLGLTMAASIVLCVLGGVYLDTQFETDGILILVGVLIGVCGGFTAMWAALRKL